MYLADRRYALTALNAGSYSLAQQHLLLAQSLQNQKCEKNGSGCTPNSVVCNLGQSLQSFNPTGLDTQTFERLAPTSGGHESVNKPGSKARGQDGTHCDGASNGGPSTADGDGCNGANPLSNRLTNTGPGGNSNSSIANVSNGTSILAHNAANKSVPSVPGVAPVASTVLGPEQPLKCVS